MKTKQRLLQRPTGPTLVVLGPVGGVPLLGLHLDRAAAHERPHAGAHLWPQRGGLGEVCGRQLQHAAGGGGEGALPGQGVGGWVGRVGSVASSWARAGGWAGGRARCGCAHAPLARTSAKPRAPPRPSCFPIAARVASSNTMHAQNTNTQTHTARPHPPGGSAPWRRPSPPPARAAPLPAAARPRASPRRRWRR